jgi:hypothetical protein
VAHNVGDALTYKILTDDTQTIIYRSVVTSWNDKEGTNLRVPHDPNMDPAIRLHNDNQNIPSPHPLVTSSAPLPTQRVHKRIYAQATATNTARCDRGDWSSS